MPQILIIEDEPSIADNIKLALELEGFQNRWASTLEEGKKRELEFHIPAFIPDFSAISKRLGEIWQSLPEKEKLVSCEVSGISLID